MLLISTDTKLHGGCLDCFMTVIYVQQTQQTSLLLIMDQTDNKFRTSIKLNTLEVLSNFLTKNLHWNQREQMGFSLFFLGTYHSNHHLGEYSQGNTPCGDFFAHTGLFKSLFGMCFLFGRAYRQFISPQLFAVPGFLRLLSLACLHYSVLNDYLSCGDSSTLLIQ